MKPLKFFFFLSVLALVLQSQQCPVKYNLSGGRPLNDSVTVSVMPFVNSAPLAKATLTQTFADALRDELQKTKLTMVPKDGDLNYEGTITGYAITPVSIQAGGDNNASSNRLTITVSIKYTD